MKTAVVTGCSSGIGLEITRMLLSEGWHVTGVSRTQPTIMAKEWVWLPCDISAPDDLWMLKDKPADALIHCAGIRGPFGPLLENDEAEWIQTIQTNLIGTYRVLKAALPSLQRSEDARILLFSGGGAFSPEPNYSAYACTKGATVALMETLAEELSNTTVTVNAVAPGFVSTPIHKGTPHEHRQAAPDAMANVVACVRHLLSPQTQGLTGRTVSAQHDDWRNISSWTIPHLTDQGTRDRHMIAGLQRLLLRGKRAI